MLLTKKGLKLWGSGILVMIMSALFTEAMLALPLEKMSLWELGFILLVVFPLIVGWVQRWYWEKKRESTASRFWC